MPWNFPTGRHSPVDARHLVTAAIWRNLELSLASGKAVNPVDERIESFLADVLALEGEDENAIREGVRIALADCEQISKRRK